jgi:hypothetical protein
MPLSCRLSPCPLLSCRVLPCRVLTYRVLSCPVLLSFPSVLLVLSVVTQRLWFDSVVVT